MYSASSDFDRKAAKLTHTVAELGHKAIDIIACLAAAISCIGSFAARATFPFHRTSIGIAYQQTAQSFAEFAAFASAIVASLSLNNSNSLRASRSD